MEDRIKIIMKKTYMYSLGKKKKDGSYTILRNKKDVGITSSLGANISDAKALIKLMNRFHE